MTGLYANFGTAEPDNYNGNQNFVAMGLQSWPVGSGNLGSASQWNDVNGSNSLAYVIEFPVPEPGGHGSFSDKFPPISRTTKDTENVPIVCSQEY